MRPAPAAVAWAVAAGIAAIGVVGWVALATMPVPLPAAVATAQQAARSAFRRRASPGRQRVSPGAPGVFADDGDPGRAAVSARSRDRPAGCAGVTASPRQPPAAVAQGGAYAALGVGRAAVAAHRAGRRRRRLAAAGGERGARNSTMLGRWSTSMTGGSRPRASCTWSTSAASTRSCSISTARRAR